jgi:hypothetical protein
VNNYLPNVRRIASLLKACTLRLSEFKDPSLMLEAGRTGEFCGLICELTAAESLLVVFLGAIAGVLLVLRAFLLHPHAIIASRK